MNRLTFVCASLMVGGFVLLGIANGHAQTAEDILNKADAVYSNAKTYQATYHWEQKFLHADKQGDGTINDTGKVKAIGLAKFVFHEAYEKPTGPNNNKGLDGTTNLLDDGMQTYIYLSGTNSFYLYSKMSHDEWMRAAARNGMLDRIMPHLKPKQGFTYTLLAPTIVNGKAVYVIEAKGGREERTGLLPHYSMVNGQRVEVFTSPKKITVNLDDLYYIDQTTFHLLQRKAQTTWPDLTVKSTQIFQSEVFDAPIPDSTFVFVMPKGAKDAWK
jgi:outer membrane lipoprotein-sorting protein